MFQPPMFQQNDWSVLAAAARRIQFACLVTWDGTRQQATHAPCVVKHEDGAITVEFHVARANLHWKLAGEAPTLAVFQGEQHYVHPGWYPTKAETGKAVPTWVYVTVQMQGTLETLDDAALHRHLEELTALNEEGRTEPWAVDDAPEPYLARMKRGIVGLRLNVQEAEGAWKLNQHKTEGDHAGVVSGLRAEGGEATAVAALMNEARSNGTLGGNT